MAKPYLESHCAKGLSGHYFQATFFQMRERLLNSLVGV